MSKIEKLNQRIADAQHAQQSALKIRMTAGVAGETSIKHLRMGVNSALVDVSALWQLLIKKGIITQEEFLTCLAEAHEQEAEARAKEARKQLNLPDTVQFK